MQPRGRRQLPRLLTSPNAKYIPLGVPEEKTYNDPNGNPIKADEYEIALVQYRTKFSSDLPATLVRGYVQLETPANAAISQHYPLTNELLNGTQVPVMINGQPGSRRHPAAVARPDHRRPPRTSRSASSSATCFPPASTATSSCRPTAP